MEETQRTDHFRIGKTHIKLNLMDIFRLHMHILGLPRASPTPNPHPPPTIHPPPQATAPSCKRPRGRRRSSRPAPPAAPGAARDAAHVARPSGSARPGGGWWMVGEIVNGLVQGEIYRKPWFLPSNIRFSCFFPIIQFCEIGNGKYI